MIKTTNRLKMAISQSLKQKLAEFIEMLETDELSNPLALALALDCLAKLVWTEAKEGIPPSQRID